MGFTIEMYTGLEASTFTDVCVEVPDSTIFETDLTVLFAVSAGSAGVWDNKLYAYHVWLCVLFLQILKIMI